MHRYSMLQLNYPCLGEEKQRRASDLLCQPLIDAGGVIGRVLSDDCPIDLIKSMLFRIQRNGSQLF